MKKYFRNILVVLLLSIFSLSSAHAYTLGANRIDSIGADGGLYSYMTITSGPNAGKTYRVTYKLGNGTAQFGSIVNNKFDSVSFNAALNSALIEQVVNGTGIVKTGTLTGTLNLGYHNVDVNLGANQAAAILGSASGAGLVLNVTGILDGYTTQFSTSVSPNFMDFTLGQHGPTYDATINAFSNNGKLNFSLNLDGTIPTVHAWMTGNNKVFFNGVGGDLSFAADLHTSITQGSTQVPEPASIALIASGLLGGMASRRKHKLSK